MLDVKVAFTNIYGFKEVIDPGYEGVLRVAFICETFDIFCVLGV